MKTALVRLIISEQVPNYKGAIMKSKIFFLFVLVSYCSLLISSIIEIKQDGTGDFETIQQGINASINGDTVLVFPGTYFENIDFSGKNITVTSRYIENQDESYIHNTIIDGNQNGSCVKIVNEEDENAMLCGFTIQNGTGTQFYIEYTHSICGGGIYVFDSYPLISSCMISNNSADYGGGICIGSSVEGYSCPTIENCTIRYNNAFWTGGGISTIFNSTVIFSHEYLCNIYLNSAGSVNDIVGSGIQYEPMEVYVDTFTISEPDEFFFRSPFGSDILNMNHAKIEPINNDLYVSPDGDDNNPGIFQEEPLQTISMALIKIASDSLHPNTIHVAEGTYSPSLTNEKFPFNCRSYVSFFGENKDTTILDLDGYSEIFMAFDYEKDFSITNLTLTNSSDEYAVRAIRLMQSRNIHLSNIKIHNYHRERNSIETGWIGSTLLDSTSLYLKNIEIVDNIGAKAFGIGQMENCIVENLLVKNNTPNYSAENEGGGGIGFSGHSHYTDGCNYKLINSEITENINAETSWPHACSAINISQRTNVDIINCTVGNNESEATYSAALLIGDYDVDCNIINSIFYGDIPREILLKQVLYPEEPCIINIRNSLIQGGETEIYDEGGNIVNWLEGNLPADANPFWDIDGEFPYALTSSSPCIDAGTLDLPEGIELPEYDLAGNPRIVGDTVDMGAYEYQGNHINEELVINHERINISVYPNPFQPNSRDHCTSIKFNLVESCTVNLDIYNIKGQKVKSLMDAYASMGEYTCRWDGKDENGKQVSSGQYLLKLNINGETRAVRKMILLD